MDKPKFEYDTCINSNPLFFGSNSERYSQSYMFGIVSPVPISKSEFFVFNDEDGERISTGNVINVWHEITASRKNPRKPILEIAVEHESVEGYDRFDKFCRAVQSGKIKLTE